MKLLILTATAAAAELVLRFELPKEVENALGGLAIILIGVIGVWLKGTITRNNEKHDLEIADIRNNQELSKAERQWLLETTKDQVNQIAALQRANEQLQEQNRQRDMEIGAQKEATARITKERDDLQARADLRHDAINQAEAGKAEALEFARKETNRADAAEGDLAAVRKELEQFKTDLDAARADLAAAREEITELKKGSAAANATIRAPAPTPDSGATQPSENVP